MPCKAGLAGHVFTAVSLFKGISSSSSSFLPCFCLLAFVLCETLAPKAPPPLPSSSERRCRLFLLLYFCMGKKKSSNKSKAVFMDEEASLSVIKNQEFMAMRAAQKIWSAPTTTEDQLRELVSDGLIQDKEFAD
jgi:hypothetical protein